MMTSYLSRHREDIRRFYRSLVDVDWCVIICLVGVTGKILHEWVTKLQFDLWTSLGACRTGQLLLYGIHNLTMASKEKMLVSNLQDAAAGNDPSLSSC